MNFSRKKILITILAAVFVFGLAGFGYLNLEKKSLAEEGSPHAMKIGEKLPSGTIIYYGIPKSTLPKMGPPIGVYQISYGETGMYEKLYYLTPIDENGDLRNVVPYQRLQSELENRATIYNESTSRSKNIQAALTAQSEQPATGTSDKTTEPASKTIPECIKEGTGEAACKTMQLGKENDKVQEAIWAQKDVAQQLKDYLDTLSKCRCGKKPACNITYPKCGNNPICDCGCQCPCAGCFCKYCGSDLCPGCPGYSPPCPGEIKRTIDDGRTLYNELMDNAKKMQDARDRMIAAANDEHNGKDHKLVSCAHDFNDPNCAGAGDKKKIKPFDFLEKSPEITQKKEDEEKKEEEEKPKEEKPKEEKPKEEKPKEEKPTPTPTPTSTPSPTPKDQEPPVLSNLQPTGTLDYDAVTISLKTNEEAACKYDTSDKAYESMGGNFDGAGTTTHAKALGNLAEGEHKYYVRCMDKTGNKNMVSSVIQFTISLPAIIMSDLKPSGTLANRDVTLSLKTNKNATCKYDTSDKPYESMQFTFDGSGTTTQVKALGQLSDGDYKYYVKCMSESGVKNTLPAIIQFKIAVQNACSEVYKSGDSKDNMDIVFVGDNFTDADLAFFKNTVTAYKDSLLATEPFKVNSNRVNIWQVTRFPDLKCVPTSIIYTDGTHKVNLCDSSLVKEAASDCPNDQIITIAKGSSTEDKNGLSNARLSSGIATVSSEDKAELFLHEFGHSFAGLLNLYANDPTCASHKACLMCGIDTGNTYEGTPAGASAPCKSDFDALTSLIIKYGPPTLYK